MTGDRGLVISCPLEISGSQLRVKTTDLDPQELRFSLLFWDKLNFPTNNMIHIGLNPEGSFLANAGILDRFRVQVVGSGAMETMFGRAHVEAFKALDRMEPGVWSLATGEKSFSFDAAELETGRGALVQLHHALPIPNADVPLEDILSFREKRRPELLALRHHLEAIYQRILDAGDGPLALNSETEALQIAIADHIKASKESGLKLRPASLNASLNLVKGVTIAAGALAAGLSTVAALMAGAGAAINVGPGTALAWGKATGTPFKYVSSYHNEVF